MVQHAKQLHETAEAQCLFYKNSDHSQIDEEQGVMDFESGIDTWVIDKEESSGLLINVEAKKDTNIDGLQLRSMDKENIKLCSNSKDRGLLRNFRIRKPTSYQELSMSSESDSDSQMKCSLDQDEHLLPVSEKHKSEPAYGSRVSRSNSNYKSSTANANGVSDCKRDKGSLSSEEISLILSEVGDSSNSTQEKKRERLLSIENVSSLADKNEKVDTSPKTISLVFKCSVCNCEFRSLDDLRNHESSHKQAKKPSANRPWNKTDFLSTFKSHLVNRGVLPVTETDSRQSESNKNSKPKRHSKTSGGVNKILFCKLCPYSCFELLKYKIHQIMFHSENEVFTCEYCDYQTRQCGNLATHIRIHFQMDCPYCTFRFSVKADLDDHVAERHAVRFNHRCTKCDFQSKSKNKLKKHEKIHFVNKYQCGNCNLFFSNKLHLKLHLKLHAEKGKQIYVCDTCGSKFKRKNSLIVHLRVHDVKRCNKCKLEVSDGDYKIHKCLNNIHKCQQCSFESADSSGLRKHICINKLYEVQKTPLNFLDENSHKDPKFYEDEEKKKKLTRSESLNQNDPLVKESKFNIKSIRSTKHKKHRRDRNKLLTLRQNIACRKIQNIIEGDLKKKSTDQRVTKKQGCSKQNSTKDIGSKDRLTESRRNVHKTELWDAVNKQQVITKRHSSCSKKIRKEHLSRSLDVVRILFGKELSLKEFFVEPVKLNGEGFVQCYYQSQQPTSPREHMERHLRQNSLLSCRFCRYRTNSEQLLRKHQAKRHCWDPAVVNLLFS